MNWIKLISFEPTTLAEEIQSKVHQFMLNNRDCEANKSKYSLGGIEELVKNSSAGLPIVHKIKSDDIIVTTVSGHCKVNFK
tara:strand:- start:461 stop:703 length:243 start_codon:yes stop_codon:yes gene_type:complete